METTLPNDFKEFLKLLAEHKVKYLLIGGYAVGYHGYPRATNDIDFWIEKSQENASKVITVLKEFGFDLPELNVNLFLEEKNIIRMGKSPIKIEIQLDIDGVNFPSCYEKRITTNLEGIMVDIINLPDLITNKKASGRLKDLADLEYLPKQ
jgi:predicted nucleotidyltransferase